MDVDRAAAGAAFIGDLGRGAEDLAAAVNLELAITIAAHNGSEKPRLASENFKRAVALPKISQKEVSGPGAWNEQRGCAHVNERIGHSRGHARGPHVQVMPVSGRFFPFRPISRLPTQQ